MYFYRLMSKEELNCKKIHNNKNNFNVYINTHKYKRGKSYVHLFLNAESCFEDFDKNVYDNCVIAKFDIPDDILFKYRIKLGGYNLSYNSYNKKYRFLNYRNAAGGYSFWLPEIAIEAKDFDYAWLIDICDTKDQNGKYFLKDSFITDDTYYQNIVYDGYLIGYDNEVELEEKYNNMLDLKQKIINVLKETKTININPKDLNNDSMMVVDTLVSYALERGFINQHDDIKVTLNDSLDNNSINITSDRKKEETIVISKNYQHSVPSFCAMLDKLGFNIDKEILHSIRCEDDVIIDSSLVKK